MKFIVVGDLHIGVSSDDPWQENIRALAMEKIYNYALDNNIDQFLFLGDIFDDRTSISHRSLEFNRKNVIDPIIKNNFKADVIIGNHDAMHKNTLTPNAITEVFGHLPNFRIPEPTMTVTYDGVDIDLISWICKENQYDIMEFVKNSTSKYCFGHFELVGFYFYTGMPSHGLDPQFLTKYDYVGSGHFHTMSSSGNVFYLGTPFTITANDNNEQRGFWVFDTEDMLNPQFVPNDRTWHRKVVYPFENLETVIDYKDFENVRVVVELNSQEDEAFRIMESNLEKVANRVSINNNYVVRKAREASHNVSDDVKQEGTLIDIAHEYVDKNDAISDEDKEAIKFKIGELYHEALRKTITED